MNEMRWRYKVFTHVNMNSDSTLSAVHCFERLTQALRFAHNFLVMHHGACSRVSVIDSKFGRVLTRTYDEVSMYGARAETSVISDDWARRQQRT